MSLHAMIMSIVMDAYALFGLEPTASFHDILDHCRSQVNQWTMDAVRERLRCFMSAARADVNAPSTYQNGLTYLKASAAMLMDPSARQCYDAWLGAIASDIQKKSLTRARLLWFNKTHHTIHFSDKCWQNWAMLNLHLRRFLNYPLKNTTPNRNVVLVAVPLIFRRISCFTLSLYSKGRTQTMFGRFFKTCK